MEKPVIGRFAPTPSGRMHLGNVFSFLIAWLSVKSRGGHILLRMEDLDTQRTSEEFAEILETNEPITFIIGGSHGLSDAVKAKANIKLSFSKMTFAHRLFKVMLLEQIYRGVSILKGTHYHK